MDAEPLSKLDTLIRRSILRHPLIFTTRWDVLFHLYLTIGGGYEWVDGELVEVFSDDTTDEQARATFFRDLDELHETVGQWDGFDDRIARARRQFILDNIDLLVHERRVDSGKRVGLDDLPQVSLTYSHAFHVPDDAEASFKAGASEALSELAQGLHYAAECGRDGGVRDAAVREHRRLNPVDPAQEAAVARLLAELAERREA